MASDNPSTRSQVSFNGGEWSPFMHDRIDLTKFSTSARTLRNLFPTPYGPAFRRPGTIYVASAKGATATRLIPFVYSASTAYVLELGNEYMRFFTGGAAVLNGSTVVEVSTPWLESELFDVQFIGDDDLMYFTHPNHPPQKLTRTSATSFTLEEVPWGFPPLLDENETTTTLSIDNAAIGTGRTLTASSSLFVSEMVGGYFYMRHPRESNYVEVSSITSSSALVVEGDYRFEVTVGDETSVEAECQQLSQDGSTWETVHKVSSDEQDLTGIVRTGTQETDKEMRVVINSLTHASAGTPIARAYLESINSFAVGLVKVTGVTNGTTATVEVLETLYSTDATPYWSEGAFSEYRGYPRAVGIFEGRLWYAGTAHEPQTYYGSEIEDYDNFPVGTLDTDRVKFKLSGKTRNEIEWIFGHDDLLIGTSGEEFRIWTGDNYQPLTPSTIPRQRPQSNNGSKSMQPKVVGEAIAFVQRGGRKVREFIYTFENNKYKSPDLIQLSEHLSAGEIVQMDYSRDPYSTLWCVTGDGLLLGMSYEREQLLNGWFAYETDGLFESVAVIPGDGGDELWVVVRRTVGGSEVRYIERFHSGIWNDQEDAYYVDCGLAYDGSATDTFSGLDHLIGKTVQVLGDGAFMGEYVVDSNGEFTLSGERSASVVHAGLKYVSTFKPMKFDIDNANGNSQGQKKQFKKIDVGFRNTMAARVYDGSGEEVQTAWRDYDDNTSTAIPLFTGYLDIDVRDNATTDPFFTIVQDRPLPMTLQSVTARYEITEPI